MEQVYAILHMDLMADYILRKTAAKQALYRHVLAE